MVDEIGQQIDQEINQKKYWNQREYTNKGKFLWALLAGCILITSLLAALTP